MSHSRCWWDMQPYIHNVELSYRGHWFFYLGVPVKLCLNSKMSLQLLALALLRIFVTILIKKRQSSRKPLRFVLVYLATFKQNPDRFMVLWPCCLRCMFYELCCDLHNHELLLIKKSFLWCVFLSLSAPHNFGLSRISKNHSFFSFFFFFLAGSRRELAMQFTLKSEYVAMVVARDLAWSALESPNIKGVFLMQRQWKLWGMSNCLRESFLCAL